MKNASTIKFKATEFLPIRIKLRVWSPAVSNHHSPPRAVFKTGKPFVIRLKDEALRAADDASLATQFAV